MVRTVGIEPTIPEERLPKCRVYQFRHARAKDTLSSILALRQQRFFSIAQFRGFATSFCCPVPPHIDQRCVQRVLKIDHIVLFDHLDAGAAVLGDLVDVRKRLLESPTISNVAEQINRLRGKCGDDDRADGASAQRAVPVLAGTPVGPVATVPCGIAAHFSDWVLNSLMQRGDDGLGVSGLRRQRG